jgi:hypothetical protein
MAVNASQHRDHARPHGNLLAGQPVGAHDPHLLYTTSIIELAQDRITARSNSGPAGCRGSCGSCAAGAALSPDDVAQCA